MERTRSRERRRGALLALMILAAAPARSAPESPWSLVRERDGIVVHTRPVEGSGIQEFRGVALVSASVEAIRAVLRDVDRFEEWFPDTSEARLLAREGDVAYQYLVRDAPWPVSDRDTVFRSETRLDPSTGRVSIRLTVAPDRHPLQPERVRVRRAEGLWLLEPVAPERTRVTFQLHLEPGGGVPQWLINAQVVDTPFEALANLRTVVGRR